MSFVTSAQLPARALAPFPGITGRYVHLERMSLSDVARAASVVVPSHQNPHEQVSYVLSGRLEFNVGDETRVMAAGDCALIPCGAPHGCHALTDCRVLDLVCPVREDYR